MKHEPERIGKFKMSKKYQPNKKPEDFYVDAAKAFQAEVAFRCMQLPEEFCDIYTNRLRDITMDIMIVTNESNIIYVSNKQTPQKQIEAYERRLSKMYEAREKYKSFDLVFDQMMKSIDLMKDEKRRLKNIVLGLIQEEKKNNPEIKDITIKVIQNIGEMEYISAMGEQKHRLKLTPKQVNNILNLRSTAYKELQSQIKKTMARKKAVAS